MEHLKAIEHLINTLFVDDTYQAIIITNEEGLPVASKINPFSKEVEYFLSAVVSTLACTGLNIASTMQLGGPDGIQVYLKSGILIIKNVNNQVYFGILTKTVDKSQEASLHERINAFIDQTRKVLFD